MIPVEQKREQIIASVRKMDGVQLDLINDLISKIDLLQKDSIEFLFAEAVAQYGNTLKKLAE